MLIAPCTIADLGALTTLWPHRGCEARFGRQIAGESTFLIARARSTLVGRGELLWTGPRMPEVAAVHGKVPEINGLDVVPAHRGRGVGTALIAAAEALARSRSFASIGLGVGTDNTAAERLYRRLGYSGDLSYIDTYTWTDEYGDPHEAADPCLFLVKTLD